MGWKVDFPIYHLITSLSSMVQYKRVNVINLKCCNCNDCCLLKMLADGTLLTTKQKTINLSEIEVAIN